MEKGTTVQYKRTLSGSVGAGVGALFNGSGRQYYILEHKNTSKYHRAGESQKIIIDQIELGRDRSCQVRYDDDNYLMVSRKHAAIVKDSSGWKIIPLSQTNSTLVNGKAVKEAWFLQNGDEIQLAIDGPKLGFIVPAGKQSLVSSIKLTERLNLFRQQALLPYKRALAVLSALVILLGCSGGYMLYEQANQIGDILADNKAKAKVIEGIKKSAKEFREETGKQIEQQKVVYVKKFSEIHAQNVNMAKELSSVTGITDFVEKASPYVYYLNTVVYVQINDGKPEAVYGCSGTAFLLNNGRFVTARHCVQPWKYTGNKTLLDYNTLANSSGAVKIYSVIKGYSSSGDVVTLKNTDFKMDESKDQQLRHTVEAIGYEGTAVLGFPVSGGEINNDELLGTDWAYANVSKNGGLRPDVQLSSSLKAGTTAHVMGFPMGIGSEDGKQRIEPIYNKLSISRSGLNKAGCIMVSEGIDHGNSGGPVFVVNNGEMVVVAIVSRGDFNSNIYNHLVPLSNLK
mgnify:CR=1 FL=1